MFGLLWPNTAWRLICGWSIWHEFGYAGIDAWISGSCRFVAIASASSSSWTKRKNWLLHLFPGKYFHHKGPLSCLSCKSARLRRLTCNDSFDFGKRGGLLGGNALADKSGWLSTRHHWWCILWVIINFIMFSSFILVQSIACVNVNGL